MGICRTWKIGSKHRFGITETKVQILALLYTNYLYDLGHKVFEFQLHLETNT